MTFLFILWVCGKDLCYDALPVKNEDVCWEIVMAYPATKLTEDETILCITLRHPKAL